MEELELRKSTETVPVSEDVIRVHNQFYVLASSSRNTQQTRVLKQQDSFLVCDESGDVLPLGDGSSGYYLGATRHLSLFELRISKVRPLTLRSEIKDNLMLSVDLMNADCVDRAGTFLARGTLHLSKTRFLWEGSLFERLRITNFGNAPIDCNLEMRFGADFKDMFEIRGMERKQRGTLRTPSLVDQKLCLSYLGLDDVERQTFVQFSTPLDVSELKATQRIQLAPGAKQVLFLEIATDKEPENGPRRRYFEAFRKLRSHAKRLAEKDGVVETSHPPFNAWIQRSRADLHLMLTPTPHGLYPYAGIPWFNTVFGRDGILTALQALWVSPSIAKGVLSYLSATQATQEEPLFDAQPGKILHEIRTGEMVKLREVPFEKYYGSIDSTPLYVILAGSYLERTGDLEFIRSIWPNIQAALRWLDKYGDIDGDGLYEYQKRSPTGLENQGWKDSHDCISYSDGKLAQSPIALCEVQGYVFEAKKKASDIARALGQNDYAARLQEEASRLQQLFEEKFWWEEAGTYAVALDGDKRPCQILTSNPGHCLFTGIVSEARAPRVVQALMSDPLFSGWGVRTLGNTEVRYNPMSYHNGSVWPHDTSIICEGFARYGFKRAALTLLDSLFSASVEMDFQRMPELFCGFSKRRGRSPILYPVACSPQAWAAGSVFLLLKACLGLAISARSNRVQLHQPVLPASLQNLKISNLRVGESTLDLGLFKSGEEVGINILRQTGPVEVSLSRQAKFTH